MKLLYFRFKSKIGEHTRFTFLSNKQNDEFNFDNIISTYKDFLCSTCFKYNCHLHGIKYKINYENTDSFKLVEYITSFKEFIRCVVTGLSCDEEVNDFFEKRLDTGKEKHVKALVYECYDNFKGFLSSNNYPDIKIGKESLTSKDSSQDKPCSAECFMSLTSKVGLSEAVLSNQYKLTHIEEILFNKLFKVFKFDPCSIYLYLRSFSNNSVLNSN
jgi:hypothetical protein